MMFGSVCSGIEAASVAWKPLGWRCAFMSEIDKAARRALAHHYPKVPLHGDFTTIGADDYGSIDLLVGGTPCQDFSIAGLRAGVAGERGNLTLEFLRLAERKKPRWIVWENVPGVLSIDGGRTFGTFLGGLAELGYGFAYRVLDAQYFGLAQRRERVFVVGYLGDWRPPAAVLFERESLLWDPAPSRKARKDVAPILAARTRGGGGLGADFDLDGGLIHAPVISPALKARDYKGPSSDGDGDGDGDGSPLIAHAFKASYYTRGKDGAPAEIVPPLSADADKGDQDTLVLAHAFDARQSDVIQYGDKTGPLDTDGHTIGVLAFSGKDHGADRMADLSPTLRAGGHHKSHANGGVARAIAFTQNSRSEVREIAGDGSIVGALAADAGAQQQNYVAFNWQAGGNHTTSLPLEVEMTPTLQRSQSVAVQASSVVRRLTPTECERLQGFPDGYTQVPVGNKPTADGPRYKQLGNSMAVPVMAWIGRRIALVEQLAADDAA